MVKMHFDPIFTSVFSMLQLWSPTHHHLIFVDFQEEKDAKIVPKTMSQISWVSDRNFMEIWVKIDPNLIEKSMKNRLNMGSDFVFHFCSIFRRFWDPFGDHFGTLWGPIWEPLACKRGEQLWVNRFWNLLKCIFGASGSPSPNFGSILTPREPQMEPTRPPESSKCTQNCSLEIQNGF